MVRRLLATTTMTPVTRALPIDLSLVDGQVYRVEVTATDHVGLSSMATSVPVTVDTSAPILTTLSLVARYVGGAEASHRIAIDYTGVEDPESGIVETICSLGSVEVHGAVAHVHPACLIWHIV